MFVYKCGCFNEFETNIAQDGHTNKELYYFDQIEGESTLREMSAVTEFIQAARCPRLVAMMRAH